MKKNIFLALSACLLSCTGMLHAQTGTITGLIKDSISKPFEGAIISLLQADDSSLVKTTFTETDGRFEFQGLGEGNYFILSVNEGYRKYRSEVLRIDSLHPVLVLPEIRLEKTGTQQLEDVKITARIPFVERKIDRTVVNVDAMISNAGTNALEMLEKSPGIRVDQDGNIQLKGKGGVVIFIDDKPSYLSGNDLAAYLKSLPASALSQIEIMTNPPAKYDAAGNSGVINIITKKSKLRGFNGNISLNYMQGIYARTNNGFNFNYRNNKFNFFGNVSQGIHNALNDLDINRTYKNEDLSVQSTFMQNSMIRSHGNDGNARLGLDYYLSEKTTLGIAANGVLHSSSTHTDNQSILRDPTGNLTGRVQANNDESHKLGNGGANLNFRHKFDSTERSLTVDADYFTYSNRIGQTFINDVYNSGGVLASREQLNGRLPSTISIYAFKTDYTHPFRKGYKLDAGYKVSFTQTDNVAEYANLINGEELPDYDKSNHFKYQESINAGYLNFSKSFKRFAFQTGLRAEYTVSDGRQLGNILKPASSFKRIYNNLFPTVYLTYKLDSAGNNQLIFSYGKRIDRPYYQDLNPFIRPLDKFTFYSGNPYLKPTFSHNLEFTYNYKGMLNISLIYSDTRDQINETIEIDANGIYFSRPGNIGKSQITILSADVTIPFAKWLSTQVYMEASNRNFQSVLYTEQLNSKGNTGFIYISNSFRFKKNWSAELSGFYSTKLVSAQFLMAEIGQMTVAVQKKILKEKGSVKVSLRDVFYTQKYRGTINNLRLTDANWINIADTRVLSVGFTYGFGKNIASRERHEGTGSESERNRVK